MNILGIELDYDFFDADQLEVYERENKKVVEDIKEPSRYEGKSTADALRMQCGIIDRFFDTLFGAGTAQKIFKGKANIRDHMEAFGIMSQGAMNARAELEKTLDKYTPNRAERRQADKENRQAQKQNSRNYQHNSSGKGKGNKNHH